MQANPFDSAQTEICMAILADLKSGNTKGVVRELVDNVGFYVSAMVHPAKSRFYDAVVSVYIRNAPTKTPFSFDDVMTMMESRGEAAHNLAVWRNQYNAVSAGASSQDFKSAALALINNYLRVEVLRDGKDWLERIATPSSNVKDEVAAFMGLLVNLTTDGAGEYRPKNILAEARKAGIPDPEPTGYSVLDDAWNGGWRKKWLWMIGAPSGHGKSALACSFAAERARQHKPVLINSFEMTNIDLLLRILCNISGLTLDRVKNPNSLTQQEEYDALMQAESLCDSYIRIYDQPCGTQEIEQRIRRHRAEFGPAMDMFEVDHIGIVTSSHKNQQAGEWAQLESTAYALSAVCKRQMAAGVAFSQVDQLTASELKSDNEVVSGGFRGSAGIYNAVDVAAFACRHNGLVKGTDGKKGYDQRYANATMIQTVKVRETGQRSRVVLDYDTSHYQLTNNRLV